MLTGCFGSSGIFVDSFPLWSPLAYAPIATLWMELAWQNVAKRDGIESSSRDSVPELVPSGILRVATIHVLSRPHQGVDIRCSPGQPSWSIA